MSIFYSCRKQNFLALALGMALPLVITAATTTDKESPVTETDELHAPRPRSGPLNPPAAPKAGEPINDKV